MSRSAEQLKKLTELENHTGSSSFHTSPVSCDPLFVNALIAWLEDMSYLSPQESLSQLEAILEAQNPFSRKGDRLLTEMRRVLTTMRRAIAQGKSVKRLVRSRIRRAMRRCGLSANLLSAAGDKPETPPTAAEASRREPQTCGTRKRAKPSTSSPTSAEAHGKKLRQADSEEKR